MIWREFIGKNEHGTLGLTYSCNRADGQFVFIPMMEDNAGVAERARKVAQVEVLKLDSSATFK